MNNYKVKQLGGMFWASDLLYGHLPLPQVKKGKQNNEFGTLLDAEMKRIKEEKK